MESISIQEERPVPAWLKLMLDTETRHYSRKLGRVTNAMLRAGLRDILADSCFYYCAVSDITPILALEGYVHSYVYCDNCLFQEYDEALYFLKRKLTQKGFREIQKMNIDASTKRFRTKRNKYSDFPRYPHPKCPSLEKGEHSVWEKEGFPYSLIYLVQDDIRVWSNLYLARNIAPLVVCNIAPECSNLYGEGVWKISLLPKHVIGYGRHLSDFYDIAGHVEYHGSRRSEDEATAILWRRVDRDWVPACRRAENIPFFLRPSF